LIHIHITNNTNYINCESCQKKKQKQTPKTEKVEKKEAIEEKVPKPKKTKVIKVPKIEKKCEDNNDVKNNDIENKDQLENDSEYEEDQKNTEQLYIIKHPGYEDLRITKSGKVWNTIAKRFIKQSVVNGYYRFNYKNLNNSVHRLMAMTFLPQEEGKDTVNHINEDKTDNRMENLEWVTQKVNTQKHSKVTSHARQVKQLDKNTGKVIKIFDQITHAAKEVNVTRRAIQKVLNGENQTAGGFKWKYVNEEHVADNIDEKQIKTDGKKVYDYDNYYVFDDGRIYNTTNKRFLKPVKNASGRMYVTLCKDHKKRNFYVNRVVADHYLPNKPHDNANVEHISKDIADNSVKNLKWSKTIQLTSVVMKKADPIIDDKNDENDNDSQDE